MADRSVITLQCVALVALAQLASHGLRAQQVDMGAVSTRDARVTGGLEVQGSIARLLTNVSVTAYSRDAPIALQRGGHVMVCSTSEFHLLRSGASGALIFGLDRGALEIFSDSKPQDAILTPDLRFVPVTAGPLDLKLRVTREGDTCVDNAGPQSPVLNVTDPFSSANYRILPGQHLLFVKGDLHKVVDHEKSPCGCPPAAPLMARKPGAPLSPSQAAAAAHPFPQAQSDDLAPTADAANQAPVGTAGSQVTTTFSYGEGQGRPPSVADDPAIAGSGATASSTATPTATQPVQEGGFFRSIGHFFRRLFGGS